MVGKFLSTALICATVAGSFYFFGEVQADPQARLALIGPVVTDDQAPVTN